MDSRHKFYRFNTHYPLEQVLRLDADNGEMRMLKGTGYRYEFLEEIPSYDDIEGLDPNDERAKYAREHASHLKRLREAPQWIWDILDKPSYMMVEHDKPVYYGSFGTNVTKEWHCVHPIGSTEAGDTAEPTPFGWREPFLNELMEHVTTLGQFNVENNGDVKWTKPAHGAIIKYDPSNDPMTRECWRNSIPLNLNMVWKLLMGRVDVDEDFLGRFIA
ncbi:uncharacterized protein F4822DRAFT_432210 [Hypoxylon trugodes]|uniref:uncharacterized protein n=1 Tax=Hypoxylon trugodes TaxID=326681 RepID=UPI0021968420|nr:uncharacterized protein F4822DRAFT_432210 [Hypoxylon trugodes]KAI1385360.1 hypothetical protein F4822DRAFT_432210 [Hypoxylon trugodes]